VNIDWFGLVLLIPILVLSLSAHELAHGLVAYRLGDPTAKRAGRLSLNPIRHLDLVGGAMFLFTYIVSSGTQVFGWAKPIPVSPFYFRNHQRGMAIVGAAGPITNFVLAIMLALIINWAQPGAQGRGFHVLFLAFQVNIVLGVFNLIPIPPLDGSRVVGALMPRQTYMRWVSLDRYGMMIVFLLIILFRSGFSRLIGWAVLGIARVFLTHYTFV
jgi:Zn-dependent protease